MKIALGADHAGYQLKDQIKQHLQQQGISVCDEGTSSPESVDYPDYARTVAHDVREQRADLGILGVRQRHWHGHYRKQSRWHPRRERKH